MLRILLRGRTGNILYQYALGRALAEKLGVPFALGASWYNKEGWAEVSHFMKLPHQAKVVRTLPLACRALRKLTRKHYWEYLGIPILRENPDDQSFDPRFLDAPEDCVLYGYFQSPLYFEAIAPSLRAELNALFAEATQVPEALRDKMMDPGSVAVHVRRKDYLNIPVFQVCDDQYYRNSMDEMRARQPDARFFIFSDDPEWCRNEFIAPDTEIIDTGSAAKNPLHDLHLMSLAKHHIIANSSYSWWAAWLGDSPGQQVIMPERWYTHGIKAPMEEKAWKPVER